MPPPSHSPGSRTPVSPSRGATGRENYTTSTPRLQRHAGLVHGNQNTYLSHSPSSPMLPAPRGLDSSTNTMPSSTSAAFSLSNATITPDATNPFTLGSHNTQNVPPFDNTKQLYPIIDAKGSHVHPKLQAKIDKGFFKAEQDWTCYRRNYFSVACYYNLTPAVAPTSEPLYLKRTTMANVDLIKSWAMSITARVDGEDGRVIELVQHTPKRDKGPLGHPEKIKLLPQPPGSPSLFSETAGGLSPSAQLSSEFDYAASSSNQQSSQTIANFDRIQFKNATANNGKRRAAQQYFHIVVELFVEISSSKSSEGQWIKVASRLSAPMVVRGRSPGHYSDERRGSSTSMPPGGGSSGDSTGGPRDPNSAGPSSSRNGMTGISYSNSNRLGGGHYQAHHASLNHSPSGSHSVPSSTSTSSSYGSAGGVTLERPEDPMITTEEAHAIDDPPGYQYYPSTLLEAPVHGQSCRPQHPSIRSNALKLDARSSSSQHQTTYGYVNNSPERQSINHEARPILHHNESNGSFQGYRLPSSSSTWQSDSFNNVANARSSCGRFQGVASSKGYYPETPAL
ncbi:hypothetical protein MMC12_002148 [Toensbergia leucococca]|nr:hypothetical protein [Toensbergia leucococca]